MKRDSLGRLELRTEERSGLGSDQAFAEQPVVKDGFTGFLVGDDLLLTTEHDVDPSQLWVVFDYLWDSTKGEATTLFNDDQVFRIKEKVADGSFPAGKGDWLLLRLDGRTGRKVRPVAAARAAKRTPLWALGHPFGLPMKFVDNGSVQVESDLEFLCDLDASIGNSGSIIVDPRSFDVVGVLSGARPGLDLSGGFGAFSWIPFGEGDLSTFATSAPSFQPAVDRALGRTSDRPVTAAGRSTSPAWWHRR